MLLANLNGAEFGLGSTILARVPIVAEVVVVVVRVVAAGRSSVGPAGSVAGIRGMLRSERASGGENCRSLELFGPGWLPVVAMRIFDLFIFIFILFLVFAFCFYHRYFYSLVFPKI